MAGWSRQLWKFCSIKEARLGAKLDKDAQESAATKEGAIALMVENPSIIKRPVLVKEGQVHVGFSVEAYQEIFG